MRSAAIAEELMNRGEDVIFVGQISDLTWVEETITSLDFTQIYKEPREFISRPDSDVLILDSYKIDINETFIRPKKWLHVVAIVDELTPNYSCTLRIHPGLDDTWAGNSKTPILSGPKYIPLRSSLSKKIYTNNDKQHNLKIAVVAGGSDPYGLVHEIANILSRIPVQFEACLFSTSNSDSMLDSRFRFVELGRQLDEITKDVDLVLTTASTSSLEFIARGLCVGLVCVVDNQRQNYDTLGKLGVAAQLGFRTIENNWELDGQKIYLLVTSSELRRNFMSKAAGRIDFYGASRIVDVITTL
jgi:spore coat polysaccharide biosynthesis predicted glycosyltransferase SpsG